MFKQKFKCSSIGKVSFNTIKELDVEAAKDYAMKNLKNGSYEGCTIGKVFVNGELVLENVKV